MSATGVSRGIPRWMAFSRSANVTIPASIPEASITGKPRRLAWLKALERSESVASARMVSISVAITSSARTLSSTSTSRPLRSRMPRRASLRV